MESHEARFLSSDGARALAKCVESLAGEWISPINTRAGVYCLFGALRALVDVSLCKATTAWNADHDLTRVLPAELREACFAPLQTHCKARLSLVCSHWRRDVTCLPGVWKDLDFPRWKPTLDVVLARSGQLPLDLCLENAISLAQWAETLRGHASRIRRLSVAAHYPTHWGTLDLEIHLPHLADLSLINYSIEDDLYVSPLFLDQDAPCLRTLSLTGLLVPEGCPAFAHVTMLTMAGDHVDLWHIFDVMPRLEHVELGPCDHDPGFPELPVNSRLRVLRINDVPTSVPHLLDLGYGRVGELTVFRAFDQQHIIDAAQRFPTLPSELYVSADCREIALCVPTATGGILRFFTRARGDGALQRLIEAPGVAFSKIRSLVLPATLGKFMIPCPSLSTLVYSWYTVDMPALEMLFIECAGYRNPADTASLPEFLGGRIHAPALTTISVIAAENPLDFCAIEHVDVSHLVSLITNTLVCDNKASLQVFVYGADGVRLDGDVDQLRSCVGKVHI